jgi:hypothetical protein
VLGLAPERRDGETDHIPKCLLQDEEECQAARNITLCQISICSKMVRLSSETLRDSRRPGSAAQCRYCCKSPKSPGDNFPAIRRSDRRPPICVVSITLPRSPVSLSSGDEVPHIFTRKSRLQPGEFLITSAKRLLQHNLPITDIAPFIRSPRQHGQAGSVGLRGRGSSSRDRRG